MYLFLINSFFCSQILAIHGYRQSDTTFSGKLGSFRKSFKKEIDFTFIKAPHKVPPLETSEEKEEDNNGEGKIFIYLFSRKKIKGKINSLKLKFFFNVRIRLVV